MQDAGRGAAVGQPEEGPGPLPVPLDEPGLDEELEVPGDARLRLAEDVGEVGDRKLALGQQREDAQARLLPAALRPASRTSGASGVGGGKWVDGGEK